MIIFLLTFIAFQDSKFYEYFEDGVRHFQAEEYEEAIVALERAIEIEPVSSPTKKTYGVQLIRYYPYHYLTYAHLVLGQHDKAHRYLLASRAHNETADPTIQFNLTLYEGHLQQFREKEPQAEVTPDVTGVTELISVGNYQGALELIASLQEDFPDDQSLKAMLLFAEDAQRINSDLSKIKQQMDQNLNDVLEKARASEILGDLESAYFFYQLVDRRIRPGHPEALAFITRYESSLGESNSQEQIDLLERRLSELQGNNVSLLERINDQNKERQNLDLRIQDLQRQSEQAKRLTPQDAPSVNTEWYGNQIGDDFELGASITSNVSLLRAKLTLNDKPINEWELRGRRSFRLPGLTRQELPLQEGVNLFELAITDYQSKTHVRSYHAKIKPLNDDRLVFGLRIAIIGLSFMLLFGFVLHHRRQRIAFRERFNPYIAGAPVLTDSMFFGRRSLLRQILNTLHNNSLMICGERRIGKTSFLHRLNAVLPEVDDQEYEFIPVMIDLQGVAEADFFTYLDHEITSTLQSRGIDVEDAKAPVDSRLFMQRLRSTIGLLKRVLDRNPKLVLLLDEVDVMNSYSERTNQQLRSVFMKGFAQHLVAVMAGIHISKRWKSEGSPWYNFFEQVQLKPFTEAHARVLVTDPVKGVYTYSREAVDLILELTDGKPYLIQKICVNLIAHILSENRRKISEQDVQYVFREIQHEFREMKETMNPADELGGHL